VKYQYENKPRMEVNKIALVCAEDLVSEYRNNRITVDFVAKDGSDNKTLADICDKLYRADEQDSCAERGVRQRLRGGGGRRASARGA
jgi:hypothetical protein